MGLGAPFYPGVDDRRGPTRDFRSGRFESRSVQSCSDVRGPDCILIRPSTIALSIGIFWSFERGYAVDSPLSPVVNSDQGPLFAHDSHKQHPEPCPGTSELMFTDHRKRLNPKVGAEGGTRTPTVLLPPAPQDDKSRVNTTIQAVVRPARHQALHSRCVNRSPVQLPARLRELHPFRMCRNWCVHSARRSETCRGCL